MHNAADPFRDHHAYLAGLARATAGESSAPLPDPPDRPSVLESLEAARAAIRNARSRR